MPAAVTLVRSTYTDADSFNAAAFNALTASSASVPDATPGTAGVMPGATTAAGLAMIAASDVTAQRALLSLSSMALQAAGAVAITGGTIAATPISGSTGAFTTVTASSTIAATGAVTGSNLSGTNTGDQTTITGNAGSATILQTARNINGVSFNGSADITVAAAAGTLTGNTLASGVTASSLTSVGTIASLVATTADINGGTIDGTTIGASTPSTGAFTALSATGAITTSGGTLETNRTGAVDAFVRISADAGRSKNLSLNTSGARRWTVSSNSTAESGSNAGSDFVLTAYSDADASLGSALTITRTNRSAAFAGGINSTAIGATTPSTGAFTTLSSTGNAGVGNAGVPTNFNFQTATSGANTGGRIGTTNICTSASDYPFIGYNIRATNSSNTYNYHQADNASALNFHNGGFRFFGTSTVGVAGDPITFNTFATLTSTGLAVTGALSATGALAIGNTVNTVSPTSPNRTVTIVIGGTTYYLAAKTTND